MGQKVFGEKLRTQTAAPTLLQIPFGVTKSIWRKVQDMTSLSNSPSNLFLLAA